MKNEFGMKPFEIKTISKYGFANASDLMVAIERAVKDSNQDADLVHVNLIPQDDYSPRRTEGPQVALDAECLSDGSIVYNIEIG